MRWMRSWQLHRNDLKVVEDAAQGVDAFYKGKALGTIGDFGCYSFHETKNYTMGEGGAILFNHDEAIRKKRKFSGKKEQTEASFSADR